MKVSKTSLDAVIATIGGELKSHGEKLDRIETQTTTTNGRVRTLEKRYWMAIGALGALSTVVGWLVILAAK